MQEPLTVPLSFGQARLWLVNTLQPRSPAYNVRTAYRLRGPLAVDALRASLQTIVERHEALRTTLVAVAGEPAGIIVPAASFALPVVQLPTAGRDDARLQALLERSADEPFDLTAAPLMRALLVGCGPDDHVLLLAVHHCAFDGGSVTPFNRELSALYAEFARGLPAALAPLDIGYADYAAWQRDESAGFAAARDLAFWRAALDGAPPRVELPADRPGAAGAERSGAIRSLRIGPEVAARLAALGRTHGATLFATLLAIFNVVLYRSTGQSDLVVGTPIANRRRTELEPLIGFFVNTLAIRSHLHGSLAFDELLRHTRDTLLAAFDHQDLPFERLAAEIGGDRHGGETPLVNVMFFARTEPDVALQLDGLHVERVPLASNRARFDLSFRYAAGPDGLTCTAQYDTARFDAATIDRFLQHFARLASAIAAAPSEPIAAFELLTAAEREALAGSTELRSGPPSAAGSLWQRFAARAAATPQAVALGDGSCDITYADLTTRAGALAGALRARGIGPGAVVGIVLPRCAQAIVGILAVIKTGAAYVPLDPLYPPERLRFMLADTDARIVLTNDATAARLREVIPASEWLNLDRPAAPAASASDDPETGSECDLAYVMYTSGSTGRPKGVLVEQAAIVNLVAATPALAVRPADVVAHLATPAFDAATYEIWSALLNGARLEIVTHEVALDARALAGFLRQRAISVAFVTSALFHHIARDVPAAFAPLRLLLTGGDVLDPAAVRAVLAHGPPQRLLQAYGPTETTTFATVYEIVAPPGGPVPIGRPLAGYQTYILDADGSPVPIGVNGQLHIGGRGLARGYLNAPNATQRAFVAHPFRTDPGARLYATGDIARFAPDGHIVFVGRRDRQIKRRGYRIEIGEIEAVLKALPGVTDAAVAVETGATPDEKRIVAYAVGFSADLRAALAARLPPYMLPDAAFSVPALLLNANGKLDLPALAASVTTSAPQPAGAPLSPAERVVAAIIGELLGRAEVGRSDDFFALGGHSLLASRVVARIGDRFEVEISLRAFFAEPTVGGLARRIAEAPRRPAAGVRAPADPAALAGLSDAQVATLLAGLERG